jgi:hypothetical protein
MSSPWHFGNTTVRNPLRIIEGLKVLKDSSLNGNLIGKTQERLFAEELDRTGVIKIANKKRDYSDMGRKWRSCLSQLGFITHKFKRDLRPDEKDPTILEVMNDIPDFKINGHAYQITPSGLRMANAETIQEQQECMLRALLAYEIPSVVEPSNGQKGFKPLFFILQVLNKLGFLENPRGLSMVEMAIVQSYRDHHLVDEVIDKIVIFRTERDAEVGRVAKKRKDAELLDQLATVAGLKRGSLKDYADVNFRYPRFTGLVSYNGKRLVLNEKKFPVINSILGDGPNILGIDNGKSYLLNLWKGAALPTDNEVTAIEEITRFRQLLTTSGVDLGFIPAIPDTKDIAELNQIRLRLEQLYQQVLEKNYALEQHDGEQVKEIIAYLKSIDKQSIDKEMYDFEIEDEPAFLEWAVWRAFLAINHLVNEPHEARRFKVDQDFLPLGCAPGNGPDLIFEFEDYVLVVEVTLTSSSRQEAAEGEPVRRHVAKEKARIAAASGKPVYGLFLSRTIDNNTAETFRIGVWYNGDEPDFINIVPITLKQFILMMEKYLTNRFDNKVFRRVLDNCLIPRNAHAPAWKKEIQKVVNGFLVVR